MLRDAAWHNLVHLILATLGAIMLCIAFLRFVDHSRTLWLSLP
jgi:hypothetical protein